MRDEELKRIQAEQIRVEAGTSSGPGVSAGAGVGVSGEVAQAKPAAYSAIQDSPGNGIDDSGRIGQFDAGMDELEIRTLNLDTESKAAVRAAMALVADQLSMKVSEEANVRQPYSRWHQSGTTMRHDFHAARSASPWRR